MWKINKVKSEDHWLELENKEEGYVLSVKWDGCCHLTREYSPLGKVEDTDYLHICGFRDFVKMMNEALVIAEQNLDFE